MAYFPCPNVSTCDDPAEQNAVQNFSAELPDRISFFSRYQCDPIGNNPLFRTAVSPGSQLEADLLAASCLHEAIITNDAQSCVGCGITVTQGAGTVLGISKAGANATAHALACLGISTACAFSNTAQSCTVECPGGSNTYTVPAGTFTAPTLAAANLLAMNAACANAAICGGGLFNTAQSCTIFCPQTNADITATVAAGIFFGLTQADADAAAQAVACALAFIACQAMPLLMDNEVEACSQECNGETVTYVVPAGAFVAATIEEANLIAFQFCVQVLSAACQQNRLPPAPANVGNSAQTCQIACAGGGTFSQTIQAGAFRLANRAAANAAALSYCNAHIYANSFCLNALAPGICVNEVYAAAVSTAGPGAPTLMGVTSGVLPPGLSLSGGLLAGIPTTPGVFAFTITAASAYGFASRDYIITVAEIVTTTLPDGDTGSPYAQAIVTNGFTDPVFTIVGGSLPNPLTLHPATGVISGDAPTEDGPFNFVVMVQDTNAQCLQDYVLTIASPAVVQMYWKLDQAVAAANTDSVTSQALFINNFGAVVTGVPAVVSNGLQITGGFCNVSETNQAALYLGAGWTWAGWVRWSSAGTGNEGMQWVFCNGPIQNFTWLIGNGEYHFVYDGVSELTGNTPLLVADVFHFVAFRYDPATGVLSYSFNGAAFVALPGNAGVMLVNPEASPYMLLGNEEVIWDEVGAFGFPMTDTQAAYLYNVGAGRTYPFTFPP